VLAPLCIVLAGVAIGKKRREDR